MKTWILKAVVQKGISFLPGKHRINHLFQRYVTKGVRLSDEYLADRLTHFGEHHGAWLRHGTGHPPVVLELGTGWYPVVPLCFYLAGAEQIHTIDISRLMGRDKLLTTIGRLLQWIREGHPAVTAALQPRPDRLAALQDLHDHAGHTADFETLLARLHLHYMVADARHTPLPPASVDLVVSNNTFEHVYPEVLADILRDFRRLLRPQGLMSHFIDMSDHFAHLDPTITVYNFLRFSPRAWRWIDNDIQPQNRWRITHYRQLYAELGLPITEQRLRPGNLADLHTVPIHPAFQGIAPEELAVSHGYLVSKMLGAG